VGSLIPLDEALERLLTVRSYREAFLAGQYNALNLSAKDLAALESIDREQLVQTAQRVRDELIRRRYRGSGGLEKLYPRTLGAWRTANPMDDELHELVYVFLESNAYQEYREVPHAGMGACLEEAFYLFCEAENIGDDAIREEEFLVAMSKALALSPQPGFRIPPQVRRVPQGYAGVTTRSGPILCAAVTGRVIRGKITPFLAALLDAPEEADSIAQRHHVTDAVRDASMTRLRTMGLVP
jgi:hypothetical protein